MLSKMRAVIATETIRAGDFVVFVGAVDSDTDYARPRHNTSEAVYGIAMTDIPKDAEGSIMVQGHIEAVLLETPPEILATD